MVGESYQERTIRSGLQRFFLDSLSYYIHCPASYLVAISTPISVLLFSLPPLLLSPLFPKLFILCPLPPLTASKRVAQLLLIAPAPSPPLTVCGVEILQEPSVLKKSLIKLLVFLLRP
ncbi:hypothetical protein GQ43DRAFT_16705 [Delitschia confertaspora ATCC 74209]|uniref:Uncharacterized protein n=1 Tax=Delitschia confertaspora ATCC 74209 TaxID=1513339 RepID=A0A9P4JW28_9PLEO|nr:hypothetical protein GQ43DRAFT_16705 [Delitschia confertaspora ATCC 74209]